MAKRFTDTGKWKKEFIRGLSAKHKLLWFYILDDCDHAGIWEVDFEVASIRIGEKLTYEDAFVALGSQIAVIGKNRWWIRDFVTFQYGNLTPKNKMYAPVMSILDRYNLSLNMEDKSPINPPIYISKGQSNGNGKSEGKDKIEKEIFDDELYIESLQMTHRGKDIKTAFSECYIHHSNAPNPPSDTGEWKQKLNTWLINTKHEKSKQPKKEISIDELNKLRRP